MRKFAKPTPKTSGGSSDPTAAAQSQRLRHVQSGRLPRYSNATPRMMRPRRMRNSGRYKALNSVAYHPEKAANIAPPAVSSHTWFPSQTGPMVSVSYTHLRAHETVLDLVC